MDKVQLSSRDARPGSATSRSPPGSKNKADEKEKRPISPQGTSDNKGYGEGLYEEIEDWSLLKAKLSTEKGLIMPSEFLDFEI